MARGNEVRVVENIEQLIQSVMADYGRWGSKVFPWFRGESAYPKYKFDKKRSDLVPKLYRYKFGDRYENRILQQFRMKAPIFDPTNTPARGDTDQWLFLAQHVGLPTRLLDWTEGLLVALYWALNTRQRGAAVYMLNPTALNDLSYGNNLIRPDKSRHTIQILHKNTYDLTWISPEKQPLMISHGPESEPVDEDTGEVMTFSPPGYRGQAFNLFQIPGHNKGNINIRAAWELDKFGTVYPVAIHPTNIHPRMSSQKSCFTIHGALKDGLMKLLKPLNPSPAILYKYRVKNKDCEEKMKFALRMMGVSHS